MSAAAMLYYNFRGAYMMSKWLPDGELHSHMCCIHPLGAKMPALMVRRLGRGREWKQEHRVENPIPFIYHEYTPHFFFSIPT